MTVCPKCKGKAECFKEVFNDGKQRHEKLVGCDMCHGSGEVQMTEQEYLQTCTTEQLAEWLQEHMECASCGCNKDICYQGYDCCKLAFVEWLKQPHTFE